MLGTVFNCAPAAKTHTAAGYGDIAFTKLALCETYARALPE